MTEKEMTSLLIKLADLGVTGVKVQYEGGGDSGGIENVVYTTEMISKEDPEAAFDEINDLGIWGSNVLRLVDLDGEITSDIEMFVENKLITTIEDWWNDDGGYGSVCIIVPSGKYKIFNDIRVTQIETYIHEGELINTTLENE